MHESSESKDRPPSSIPEPATTRLPVRHAALYFALALAVIFGGFFATVSVANSTIYSASSFVSTYLQALAHGDSDYALAMPGVNVSPDDRALMQPAMLGQISDISILSDRAIAGTTEHEVTYRFRSGGALESGSLRVERSGSTMLIFPRWQFTASPTVEVSVRVANGTRFRVNGVTTKAQPGFHLVLAPGRYSFDYQDQFVSAPPKIVLPSDPSAETEFVSLNVQANSALTRLTQQTVDQYLARCVSQRVLFPRDCPFGFSLQNRLVGLPTWTITTPPEVELVPGEDNAWRIDSARGAATVTGTIQTLSNGKKSALKSTVPFVIDFTVTINGNGSISLHPM